MSKPKFSGEIYRNLHLAITEKNDSHDM